MAVCRLPQEWETPAQRWASSLLIAVRGQTTRPSSQWRQRYHSGCRLPCRLPPLLFHHKLGYIRHSNRDPVPHDTLFVADLPPNKEPQMCPSQFDARMQSRRPSYEPTAHSESTQHPISASDPVSLLVNQSHPSPSPHRHHRLPSPALLLFSQLITPMTLLIPLSIPDIPIRPEISSFPITNLT